MALRLTTIGVARVQDCVEKADLVDKVLRVSTPSTKYVIRLCCCCYRRALAV